MTTASATIAESLLFPGEAVDIAEANLRAAEGLPGAEFDREVLLDRIDEWSELVGFGARRMSSRFHQNPQEYENSRPYFLILVMVTVLQRNLHVRYRHDLMQDPVDWSDSRSRFIHGALTGYGGTCASMPVLYAAIGRRLGWPLYLVGAKQHLFVRWQDERNRLNIEATGQGLTCHPDEYYHQWPLPIEPSEIRRGWYMHNFTRQREWANFVHDRAICLRDNMQWASALRVSRAASNRVPNDPNYRGTHSITTVNYLAATGSARYDVARENNELLRVIDHSGPRKPEAWEKWAAPQALVDYRRILANREARRRRLTSDATSIDDTVTRQ